MTLILVVDPSPTSRRRLTRLLRGVGYPVDAVADADRALTRLRRRQPEAMIVALSQHGALTSLGEFRRGNAINLIALSEPTIVDVVDALDAGADDYLAQPVDPDELLARLRAALRRAPHEPLPTVASTADFSINFTDRRVAREGKEVHLTPTEWKLVELLVMRPGRVVSHQHLLREVWGPTKDNNTTYLRVFMATIRHKLEPEPSRPRYFLTEPGYGFRFQPGPAMPAHP